MLRALIVALVVANLAFFAWTRGWLDAVIGARAIGDREPDRMQRQYRPDSIKILPPEAASAASGAAAVSVSCFEAGPFAEAELTAAQGAVQAVLPAGSWVAVRTELPGAWMVYMGRYASRDMQARKEEELKRRKVAFEEITEPPSLAPGLSLGRFEDRAAAGQALDRFTRQGIHTARVAEIAAPSARTLLRVEKADPVLATRIAALKADAIAGKGFNGCGKATGL